MEVYLLFIFSMLVAAIGFAVAFFNSYGNDSFIIERDFDKYQKDLKNRI